MAITIVMIFFLSAGFIFLGSDAETTVAKKEGSTVMELAIMDSGLTELGIHSQVTVIEETKKEKKENGITVIVKSSEIINMGALEKSVSCPIIARQTGINTTASHFEDSVVIADNIIKTRETMMIATSRMSMPLKFG